MKKQIIKLTINKPQDNNVYYLSMYIRENENGDNLSPPFKITINVGKKDNKKQIIKKENENQKGKEFNEDDDDIDYKGLSKKCIDELINILDEEYGILGILDEENMKNLKQKIIELQCDKNEISIWVEHNLL